MTNKTQPTGADPYAFIDGVEPAGRRGDAETLLPIFERASGEKPVMWGESMVGFGRYHYKYESGREGDYFLTGFSPRKSNLSLYVMPGVAKYPGHLARLGKHKHSVSCLYLKTLADVDLAVLEDLIAASVRDMRMIYRV